jgi:hypothetical protein
MREEMNGIVVLKPGILLNLWENKNTKKSTHFAIYP